MSSPGTGADITALEAHDLLNKWMTESTKVQAALSTPLGLVACVMGVLLPLPGGIVGVAASPLPPLTTFVGFNPALAVRRKYGDTRAFPADKTRDVPGAPKLLSALNFVFADDSQITLFEVARDLDE